MSALVAQTLAISSMATLRVRALPLSPPYSGGKGREKRPCWRNSWTTSQGNSSVSSISAARGAMRPRASSRTDPCTISCSSLRRMSTAGSLWSGYLTSVRLWPLSGAEKLAGDDHPLDLIGALVDLARLGVAQPHRRGVGVGTAGRGADLHRGVGDGHADVGAHELGDGGVAGEAPAAVGEGGGVMGHRPGRGDLDGHLREPRRGRGEPGGGRLVEEALRGEVEAEAEAAELVDGRVEGALGDPRRLGADPDPAAVEAGHRQPEAAALGSDPVGGGDPHRLEDELGGRGPPQPELAQRAGGAHPGPRRLDEEGADPPRARAPGAGHDQVEIGLATVGDTHLGAVEDVVVAVAHRPGGERGGVAAAPRLAEGEGAEPLAGGEPGEVAPLLVLVAEEREGLAGDADVDVIDHRAARALAGHRPDRLGEGHVPRLLAAERGRGEQAGEPATAGLGDELTGAGLAP